MPGVDEPKEAHASSGAGTTQPHRGLTEANVHTLPEGLAIRSNVS